MGKKDYILGSRLATFLKSSVHLRVRKKLKGQSPGPGRQASMADRHQHNMRRHSHWNNKNKVMEHKATHSQEDTRDIGHQPQRPKFRR